MKLSNIYLLTVVGLTLALGVTGCQRKPKTLTDIPGRKAPLPPPVKPTEALPGPVKPETGTAGRDTEAGRMVTPAPPVESTIPPVMTEKIAANPDGTIPTASRMDEVTDDGKYRKDREFFKSNTVYFDFDRSAVKAGERVKVEEVALYLKGDANVKLQIEGHCDERGTEEYNRALGERRALSLREYLVHLGIGADRIHTISFGEDQPAVPGHNEAAWAKNRRGEFVLLKPKQ